MDTKDVYLNIILNYDGQKYEQTFTDFQSLKEIKNMSKQVFEIEDDIFNVTKYNNKDKKPKSIIESDRYLMLLMEEIDDYNYKINLELPFDKSKTNKQWEEKKEEIKEEIKIEEKKEEDTKNSYHVKEFNNNDKK